MLITATLTIVFAVLVLAISLYDRRELAKENKILKQKLQLIKKLKELKK
jgi:hypothetical protein